MFTAKLNFSNMSGLCVEDDSMLRSRMESLLILDVVASGGFIHLSNNSLHIKRSLVNESSLIWKEKSGKTSTIEPFRMLYEIESCTMSCKCGT